MLQQRFFPSSRIPSWLSLWRKRDATPLSVTLTKQIERQFLYRGASLLEVKTLEISSEGTSVAVEIIARPLYQDDSRLKYKTWAQVFAEQVFADTATVLWLLWTHAPTLAQLFIRVHRRPVTDLTAANNLILFVHAAGADLKTAVLHWKKHAPCALLCQCQTVYKLDPHWGLKTLAEPIGSA